MPYCLKCVPFSCGKTEGLISISWSTSSSFRAVDGDCSTGEGFTPGSAVGTVVNSTSVDDEIIPGPITGNVSITAYAFPKGTDRWLGVRCIGNVSASQNNIVKYDCETDKYYIIPSKANTAQVRGQVPDSVTLAEVACTTTTVESRLENGATITTELGTEIGHGLQYTGGPMNVQFPNLGSYIIFGQRCYLSSFNLNVDFPNTPATVVYGFQFILSCGEDEVGPKVST
jgi:hypothetical protein